MAWILLGVVVLPGLLWLSFSAPVLIFGVAAVAGFLALLIRAGLWRSMAAVTVAVSVFRSSILQGLLPDAIWYTLQLTPIAVMLVAAVVEPKRQLRTHDIRVLSALTAMVLAMALSSLLSTHWLTVVAQSLLLALVMLTLGVTYARRWTSAGVIRGDLSVIFWAFVALQAVGVSAAALGQAWAFDPDYGRYTGLFSNANYAGVVSAMAIALGIYLMRDSTVSPAILGGTGVLAVAMLMSGSRGSFIAIFAGLLVLVLGRGSRRTVTPLLVAAAVLAGGVLLFNPSAVAFVQQFLVRDASTDITSGRIAIYGDLLKQFQVSPLLGTGYRTTELSAGAAGHNVYLSVLAESGLIGAAAFATLIMVVIVASRNRRAHRPLVAAVTTVAVMELTESSVFGFGGPTAFSAWVIALAFAASGAFISDEYAVNSEDRGVRPSLRPQPRYQGPAVTASSAWATGTAG